MCICKQGFSIEAIQTPEFQHDTNAFLAARNLIMPTARQYFEGLWLPEVKKVKNILSTRGFNAEDAIRAIEALRAFKECLECRVGKIFGSEMWGELTMSSEDDVEIDQFIGIFNYPLSEADLSRRTSFISDTREVVQALVVRYCHVVYGYGRTADAFTRRFGLSKGMTEVFFGTAAIT